MASRLLRRDGGDSSLARHLASGSEQLVILCARKAPEDFAREFTAQGGDPARLALIDARAAAGRADERGTEMRALVPGAGYAEQFALETAQAILQNGGAGRLVVDDARSLASIAGSESLVQLAWLARRGQIRMGEFQDFVVDEADSLDGIVALRTVLEEEGHLRLESAGPEAPGFPEAAVLTRILGAAQWKRS